MDLDQLLGRYFRLQEELATVRDAQPGHQARIDRIAAEIAATEREIVALQPRDEQCSDALPGLAN